MSRATGCRHYQNRSAVRQQRPVQPGLTHRTCLAYFLYLLAGSGKESDTVAETSNAPASIPLCDVNAQYRQLKPLMDAAVLRVLESGQAINGPDVAAFEQEAARACQVNHAIGCADGTTALLLALTALDIGPGDEVILPPFTFFATVGSIVRVGAKPVFADIDPATYNIAPEAIERVITPRTKAILPVHLFGQCAEIDVIRRIAADHALYIIEDAAQSYGATYRDRPCGGLADIGCFSFYPSKNLGTLGDAGMVTTNDTELATKLRALRNHGSEVKYFHKHIGW
ncbi:MAG: DegT/DnrJ/EryC1/StrS family aminotransferase, partial [Gemmataceae bacterium]